MSTAANYSPIKNLVNSIHIFMDFSFFFLDSWRPNSNNGFGLLQHFGNCLKFPVWQTFIMHPSNVIILVMLSINVMAFTRSSSIQSMLWVFFFSVCFPELSIKTVARGGHTRDCRTSEKVIPIIFPNRLFVEHAMNENEQQFQSEGPKGSGSRKKGIAIFFLLYSGRIFCFALQGWFVVRLL